ncbi:MAG: hypothetical protein R3C11_27350 [Planctomycetaceae bacterium]
MILSRLTSLLLIAIFVSSVASISVADEKAESPRVYQNKLTLLENPEPLLNDYRSSSPQSPNSNVTRLPCSSMTKVPI